MAKSPPSTRKNGQIGHGSALSRTGSQRSGRPGRPAPTRVVPRRRRRPSGPDDLRSTTDVSTPYEPLPAHVDLPALDRESHRRLARRQGLRAQPAGHGRRPAVDLLRGPADRERDAGHPPRRGTRLQGRLPPVQDDEGLPRPAHGRLGLPRPARRAGRREGTRLHRQARHRGVRHRRVQRALPRVRAAPRRRLRRTERPHGVLGRFRQRLLDDEPRTTSNRSGGRCRRSSTEGCSSRTTGSRRTARDAAPGCPTTRSPRATRTSSTRRCTCGSR